MDGHFVPNITFGPQTCAAIRPHIRTLMDVHLMIAPVDPFIDAFVKAGANILTVHPEAGPHLHRTLQAIRAAGARPGVALNPATPVAMVEPVLGDVDLVLVMSVNPGFGGQAFIRSQLAKIETLRKLIDRTRRAVMLEVDGGVNEATARDVVAAGADVLVAGSAVFRGDPGNYSANIKALRGGA
jgi:ribulose-phosphate 3-epimerase